MNKERRFRQPDSLSQQGHSRRRLDSDVRATSAPVSLGSDDHVVMSAERHTGLLPSIEEDTSVNSAAGALLGSDGPVLIECGGSLDGRLLYTRALEEIIRAFRRLDGALGRGGASGVVLAEVFDDVVLDQGITGPAVDSEVLGEGGIGSAFVL